MKILLKLLISAALFICYNNIAQAQFFYGIKGGVNSSRLRTVPTSDSKIDFKKESQDGLSIAGLLKYRFSPALAVQMELQYIEKGGNGYIQFSDLKTSDSGTIFKEKYLFIVRYVQIPLIVQYCYSIRDRVQFFSNMGVYGARKMMEINSFRYQIVTGKGSYFEKEEKSVAPFFNKVDVGAVFGVGAAMGVGDCKGVIVPEIRFTQSFGNSKKYANLGPNIEFSISYISKLGK